MKNLSLALNVLLVIAVGVLFYLHFSSCKPSAGEATTPDSTSAKAAELPVIRSVNGPIAYINFDSLLNQYKYVNDVGDQLEAYAKRKGDELKHKVEKFQTDVENFKNQASTMNQDIAVATQEGLAQREYNLMQEQQALEVDIAERKENNYKIFIKKVDDHLRQMSKERNYSYVFTYTKGGPAHIVFANDSLEITREVITGLNQAYKKGK